MASWFYLYLQTESKPFATDYLTATIEKVTNMSVTTTKQHDIHIDEGTTHWIEVEAKNPDGTAMNLSGCNAVFTSIVGDHKIQKACLIEGNVVSLRLEPSETVEHLSRWYQIRIFNENNVILQMVQGIIYIRKAHKPYTQNPLGGES